MTITNADLSNEELASTLEERMIAEEYKIWKKNTPSFIFTFILTMAFRAKATNFVWNSGKLTAKIIAGQSRCCLRDLRTRNPLERYLSYFLFGLDEILMCPEERRYF
ncbi:hypothetical protein HJC23_011956 [Cyclotella cryptica]|uniref:Uncharacterized protein n=1 Tax=Cyclotella cryptica TaxID=29204 RepID=A0ABD3QQC1_9STRA